MKVDRLVSIIMLLLEKERIGAQELAQMFEVSPRTIYRDIDTINLAGIPIMSTSGVGGGFEIMQKYKVDKKVFSSVELSTILMGLSNLSNMIQGEELVNAVAKVKSFIPEEKAREVELKSNQILIDLTPWIGNRNLKPYLLILKNAIQENRLVYFEYTNRLGTMSGRKVEPYQLVLKGNQWYWQGYCLLKNDFRFFKLTRMSNLKLLDETFVPRSYERPVLDISETVESIQEKIRLRIHKSIIDRLLDFCEYENFTPDGDEYFFVNFPFIENDYYYDMLLSFGNKCECLEPQHVRMEIKRRAAEIVALYER